MASRIAASRGSSSSTTRAARIMPTWPDVPAGVREEPVGAGMVPHPGQAGAGQHSTHRPFHRAEDETGEHRGEYLISRCGETGTETLQQRRQGIGYTDLGGHWWNTPIYWRCCKHHQCSAPFHEMPGRRAAGMVFNSTCQMSPFPFSDSVIRYFGPWKSAKVEARRRCRISAPSPGSVDHADLFAAALATHADAARARRP